jgi:hypothetical protein
MVYETTGSGSVLVRRFEVARLLVVQEKEPFSGPHLQ